MKLPRGLLVWAALAVCAALVVGAMAWLTRNVLDSKRESSLAEARAALEEQTRLALWRMDAAGSAIVLRENQRLPMAPSPPAAEVRARFTLPDGCQEIEVENPSKSVPPISPAACTAAFGVGELAWQALPKDNTNLKMQVAARNSSTQQQRYDSANQSDYNVIELAQRAKAIEGQALNSNPRTSALGTATAAGETGAMRPVWIAGELYLLRRYS